MSFVVKAVKGVVKGVIGVVKGVFKVAGMLLGLSKPKGNAANEATDGRLNKRLEPEDARKIIFGKTAAAVDLRYWEVHGSKWDRYSEVLAAAGHEIDGFENFYIEDDLVTFSGNNATGKYAGALSRTTRTGAPGQTALSVGSGSYWNATSKFTGTAHYALAWTKDDDKKLPNGIPSRYTQVVRGAKVYDPRKDSTRGGSGSHRVDDQTTWSYATLDSNGQPIGRNNALQMLWYLLGWRITSPQTGEKHLVCGRGIDPNDFNWPEWIAAANDAEALQLYTDCILSTGDDHERNESIISCDGLAGELLDPGGLWTYRVIKDDTADVAVELGEDDIAEGEVKWDPQARLSELFNEVAGTYIDPSASSLYQSKAYPTVTDQSYIDADGYRKRKSHNFQSVQDPALAQKLARVKLNRTRFTGEFTATFGFNALKAQVWSIVELTLDRFGMDRKLFRVMSQEVSDQGVSMVLREEDPSIYVAGSVTIPPAPSMMPKYNVHQKVALTNFAVFAVTSGTGNSKQVGARATWEALPGNVRSVEVQYKPTPATDWIAAGMSTQDALGHTVLPLLNQTDYQVRARTISLHGVPGDWAQLAVTTSATSIDVSELVGLGTLAILNSIDLANTNYTTGLLPASRASSGLVNGNVSIGANGALVGGGGGQVTIPGLGGGSLAFLNNLTPGFLRGLGTLDNLLIEPTFSDIGNAGSSAYWTRAGDGGNSIGFSYNNNHGAWPLLGVDGGLRVQGDGGTSGSTGYQTIEANGGTELPVRAGETYLLGFSYRATDGGFSASPSLNLRIKLQDGSYTYQAASVASPVSAGSNGLKTAACTMPANAVSVLIYVQVKWDANVARTGGIVIGRPFIYKVLDLSSTDNTLGLLPLARAAAGLVNTNVSIGANGTLSGGGGGQVTIGGLGYTGALNATYGAAWASNLTGRPVNLSDLVGNEGILNNQVSIGANGSLAGGGGGQVTIGGLGYTGALNATYGASWGSTLTGRPVNLSDLVGTEGIRNSQISIGANGSLAGGGGGQVTYGGIGGLRFGSLSTFDYNDLSFTTGSLPTTRAAGGLVNTNVSIAANGALTGGGGGQVTYRGLGVYSAIPSDNLIPDPNFDDALAGTNQVFTAPAYSSIMPTGGETGGPALRINATGTINDVITVFAIPVQPNERIYVKGRIYVSSDFNHDAGTSACMTATWDRRSGGKYYNGPVNLNGNLVKGQWNDFEGYVDAPGDAYQFQPRLTVRNQATAGYLLFTEVRYSRVVKGPMSLDRLDNYQGSLPTTRAASGLINSNVSISAAGALSGGGGGQVTIGGLGYLGDLNATRNTHLANLIEDQFFADSARWLFGDFGVSTVAFRTSAQEPVLASSLKAPSGLKITGSGVTTTSTTYPQIILKQKVPALAGQQTLRVSIDYHCLANMPANVGGLIQIRSYLADGTVGYSYPTIHNGGLTAGQAGTSNVQVNLPANAVEWDCIVYWAVPSGTVLSGSMLYSGLRIYPAINLGATDVNGLLPTNRAVTGLINSSVSISASGVLSGGGGGQVTPNGLGLENNADVTKSTSGPAELTLNYASDGTLSSTLPVNGTYKLTPAGGAAYTSGVTWAVTVVSGTFAGTAPSISSSGVLSLNSGMTSTEAILNVTATYNGRSYPPVAVKVKKNTAAPPSGGGGGGGGGSSASAPADVNFNTTSFSAVASSLSIVMAGTTATLTAANIDLWPESAAPTGATFVQAKWQRETSPGVWADVGSVASASPNPFVFDEGGGLYSGNPGSITCNATVTGLTAGSTQKFRLVMRVSSGVTRLITPFGTIGASS